MRRLLQRLFRRVHHSARRIASRGFAFALPLMLADMGPKCGGDKDEPEDKGSAVERHDGTRTATL